MGQVELVLAVWVALASLVSTQGPPGGYYQTKYDSLDVEDVLNHKRLVQHYAACLLNRGPCPPQGADLKRILPEALDTNCLRCTEKQKLIILKTVRRLRSEYSTLWKELVDFWDPSGQRIRKIENSIDSSFAPEDVPNFIDNRFGDSDSGNDLAAPVKPVSGVPTAPYPAPGYLPPSTTTTRRPTTTTTRNPTTTTTTRKPTTTTTTRKPITTTKATSSPTTNPPLPCFTQKVDTLPSSDTNPPSFLTVWKLTAGADGVSKPPSYGWRPQPTVSSLNLPLLKFDAGVRFLGSIGELGTKVLQAGTEVAGMVLSRVQALVNPPVNCKTSCES